MLTVQVEMKSTTSSFVNYWHVSYELTEDCLKVDPEVVWSDEDMEKSLVQVVGRLPCYDLSACASCRR